MATGTTNPPGSNDPRDLRANAENLDLLITGPALNYPDRLGVSRRSWAGLDASYQSAEAQRDAVFQDHLTNTGYELPSIPYAAGILIERETQLIERSGEFYRAKAGVVPFTTTGTWSTDELNLVAVGDAALRQELQAPTGTTVVRHTDGGVTRTLADRLRRTPAIADDIIQARLMAPNFGFNNGTTDTSIFPGASNAFQGVALLEESGVTYVYVSIRVSGGAWTTAERHRIVRFPLATDGASHSVTEWSNLLQIGHGADLSVQQEGADVVLYTSQSVTNPALEDTLAGKGYSRIVWRGAATAQADVQNFVVFGQPGSGHPYQEWNRSTVAVSEDGQWMILATAPLHQGYGRTVAVYDFPALQAMPDKTQARPRYSWNLREVKSQSGNTVQGMCSDGLVVYVLFGGTDVFGENVVDAYSLTGELISSRPADGPAAFRTLDGLLNDPLGTPWRLEPEGISCYKGGVVFSVAEGWYASAPIVSANGSNWAGISTSDSTGIPPTNGSVFTRTTKTASGPWLPGTDYRNTSNLSDATKTLYYLGGSIGLAQEEGTSNGIMDVPDPSAVRSGQGSGATSIGMQHRGNLTVRAYSERLQTYFDAFQYTTESRLQVYDQRYGNDNTKFVSIQANFEATEHSMVLRGSGTASSASPLIKIHAATCPSFPHYIREFAGASGGVRRSTDPNGVTRFSSSSGANTLYSERPDSGRAFTATRAGVDIGGFQQNTAAVTVYAEEGLEVRFATINSGTLNNRWRVASNGILGPMVDATFSLGQPSLRPSEIFAVTGTINTSDARHKTPVRGVSSAELNAGRRLIREIGVWQWLSEVDNKGPDGARLHVGPTVQAAIGIFESEGLDPMRYGMICYDEWDDTYDLTDAEIEPTGEIGEDGQEVYKEIKPAEKVLIKAAGSLYGFREGQVHALMLYALSEEMDSLSGRISALEDVAKNA